MAREGKLSAAPEWLEEAKAGYERTFGARDREAEGTLFDQIEGAAFASGMAFVRRLIEEELGRKFAQDSCAAQPCPRCKKPCEPRSDKTETRQIMTRAGPVSYERLGYYCTRCRVVFFPSGPEAGAEG